MTTNLLGRGAPVDLAWVVTGFMRYAQQKKKVKYFALIDGKDPCWQMFLFFVSKSFGNLLPSSISIELTGWDDGYPSMEGLGELRFLLETEAAFIDRANGRMSLNLHAPWGMEFSEQCPTLAEEMFFAATWIKGFLIYKE